LGPQRGHRRKG
jgi:hypothetical protein